MKKKKPLKLIPHTVIIPLPTHQGLHNEMFPFENLLYQVLIQNTLLPWCLITQECNWVPTNLVPKLFGKPDKKLNTPGCYNNLQQCESSYSFPGQEN